MDHLMNLNVIIERVSANRHKGAKSQSCHGFLPAVSGGTGRGNCC